MQPNASSPFIGPAYTALSPNLAVQRCVNLFMETAEVKDAKVPAALYGCPGLALLASIDVGPWRGLHTVGDTLYGVSGSGFYAIDTSFSATLIGNLSTTSGPVSIIDNGKAGQVCVSDGVKLYVSNGGVFVIPPLPSDGPPGSLVYQDTLGVYNELGTQNIWQSNINDLTTWDALNYTVADGSSDSIVGLIDTHRQIVALKAKHMEFYINAGNAGFVFQRLDGVFPDVGCRVASSICRVNESVLWLGSSEIGQGVVYLLNGYEPTRVSNFAMEYAISQYTTISDAVGMGYQQAGHTFYLLSFPTAGVTWCLDLTVTRDMGMPVWHERRGFYNGSFTAYEPICMTSFAGKIVAGSNDGSNLYSLDLNVHTDNGATRKWLRSWRGELKSTRTTTRFSFLELDYEPGIDVDPNSNPQFVLRYSDDSGKTWSSEIFTSAGQTGETMAQARFDRLGTTPRGGTSDRVFELSSTDPFKVALLGGYLS